MLKKSRSNTVDSIKFIASILVMLIHTPVFSRTDTLLWQFDLIARLAVPFFITCSGYYFAERLEIQDGCALKCRANAEATVQYLKKLVQMYFTWAWLYLFVSIRRWIESGWFSPMAFVDWGISLFTTGSYFHLWYLLYLIYAVAITYLASLHIPVQYYPAVIVPLYMIEVLQYGYRGFMPAPFIQVLCIFDRMPCLSAVTRVLPLFMLGMYMAHRKKETSAYNVFGFFVSLVLLAVERNLLRAHGQLSVSYIVFSLPVAYFFFQLVRNHPHTFPDRNCKILGEMSTYIYLIHPLFYELMKLTGIESDAIRASIWMPMSIAGSYLMVKVKGSMGKLKR